MRFSRSPLSRFIIMLVVAALPLAAMANSVGRPSGGGASIDWPVTISGYEKVRLTVVSPSGEVYVKEFTQGRTPSFMVADLGGEVEEGGYAYELRVEPRVSASVKQQLANARAAGDDAAAKKIMRAAGLGDPIVQSGGFTVLNGSIISPDGVEPDSNDGAAVRTVTTDSAQTTVTTNRPSLTPETQDVVYNDDLIVTGSMCVGFDCVNGESFGFDTIRLKENNLRIKFEDTSTSSGFPTTDWELTANDSASGGSNKFSITDVTAGTVPFTATGSAPTHSLFISSTGRIGNRTSAPVLDLHIATGNTPAIRLDQTNASGFTAQVWDIAGNEANFFVRDVTGGSRLPFRIRPGAPTSSLDISASGNVGVATTSPQTKLHVENTAGGETIRYGNSIDNRSVGLSYFADSSGTLFTFGPNYSVNSSGLDTRYDTTDEAWAFLASTRSTQDFFRVNRLSSGGTASTFFHINNAGLIGIGGITAPTHAIHHSSGAHLTTAGVWTNASSRELKDNIAELSSDEARAALEQLKPVTYVYKVAPDDPQVGFIAEDVPEIVAQPDHQTLSPMDIVATLTKVVQDQQKTIDELSKKIEQLEQKQ